IEVSIFIKDGLAVSCSGRGRPPLCRDRCTITSSSHGDLTTRLGPLVRDCLFVRQACLFRSSPLSNRVLSTQLPEAVPLSATCGRARYLEERLFPVNKPPSSWITGVRHYSQLSEPGQPGGTG